MGMISVEKRGKVALVWLDRSVTNAINMECVQELSATIKRLGGDPESAGGRSYPARAPISSRSGSISRSCTI